ncbi:hypothetical protein M9H77_28299 [Catharanthus roseus]|uniref:Uncharacterized protein n=1 Tax=Catharanthus roseus TaxID=4058 RepID=A0ACC0AJ28_CATRO|nr:hypothetical protein M9H77_28299 [Catharanthus roseus]
MMIYPVGRRVDDDLDPVTNRTGRAQGRTITVSSRGLRGRHIFIMIQVHPGLLPNHHLYRLDLDLLTHHTCLALYGPARKLGVDFFDQIVGGVPADSSYNIHGYTTTDYGVSSSEPFIGRDSGDMGLEGSRGLGEEPDMVRSQHIGGDGNERVHDDSDDDDDDDDDNSLVTEKKKGLTGSLMSVMSKISGSRNKRPDKAHDTPAPTQRKKVKSSDWKQTRPTKGGPIDPKLIPLYGGNVAGPIWCGHDHGLLKSRLRYMALTGWTLLMQRLYPWRPGQDLCTCIHVYSSTPMLRYYRHLLEVAT